MLAICTYSLAKCGAAEIMDVVANHAFALIKRAEQWQVIQSSERSREKASLRASEERYLSLFEQMTEGFALHEIICDEDGAPCDYRFLEINPAFERLTGLKRTDALGKSMREVLPEEDPKWVEVYGAVALTGEAVRFEKYSPELKRHFNVLAYRPAPRQFAVLVTEITERKEAEAIREHRRMEDGLRTASLYARSLLEASLDPLVTISPDGKITDVNQATELVTGVPRGRLVGTSFSEYFTAPRQAEEGYHKVLSDGLVRDYPLTIRHVSGRTTDVLYNATVYRNEAGEVQGVFAAARDVTERKRLEEELRVASLYARSLIEASLDPLVTISPEGQITDVNEATERATGVPRGRLIGSDFSDYFTEPDLARAGYRKVLADGLVRDYPLTIRNLAGHTTDVLYNAVVYCDEAGQVQGVFAAARDVTERKRAEAELARYRDHLEELVRQRTSELQTANTHLQRTTAELVRSNQELEQFAYVASHDLQEPLRAVTGYLGLIEQQLGDELDERGRHHVAGAVQGAARMHTLITDLLALSRVGSRGQAFESADLNTVLDQALHGLGVSIQETSARIVRDPLPTLRVDAGQIVQVFQNLIGNALKFCGERPPEIHISAQPKAGQWVFAVRDNGIGIEPQYFDRIFLVFQRLHTRQRYPGTGIGLAICKKIVERHDGTIWVESKPDQGSTFCFTIPDREML
jgi:PAS domain S-box-containing protein